MYLRGRCQFTKISGIFILSGQVLMQHSKQFPPNHHYIQEKIQSHLVFTKQSIINLIILELSQPYLVKHES